MLVLRIAALFLLALVQGVGGQRLEDGMATPNEASEGSPAVHRTVASAIQCPRESGTSGERSVSVPQVEVERLQIASGAFVFDALAAGPATGEPVLLLHGFPQTGHAFRPQVERLGACGFRAVAPDQRGYSPGARPAAVSDYTMRRLVGDVFALADALEWDQFHLVGHDWGGAVSWVAAAARPDRIRTLTVLSTPHPSALSAARADPSSDQGRRSSYFADLSAPDAADRLLADDARGLMAIYGDLGKDQIAPYVQALSDPAALDAALNWYRAAFGSPSPPGPQGAGPRLSAVEVPTLYAWGRNDRAFSRDAAERTGEHVVGPYRFEVLDGGHWLPETESAAVTALLLEQLRSGGTAPTGREALRGAAAWLGMPADGAVWSVRARYAGWRLAVGQSREPGPPWDTVAVSGEFWVGPAGRSRTEEKSYNRGGTDRGFRQVLDDTTGWHEWTARHQWMPLTPAEVSRLRARWDRSPASFMARSLVSQGLRADAAPVAIGREGGGSTVRFHTSWGSPVEMVLEQSGRPVEARLPRGEGAAGTGATIKYRFTEDGRPAQVQFDFADAGTGALDFDQVEVFRTSDAPAEFLAPPSGSFPTDHPQAFRPHRLADGVVWLRTYSGPGNSYNVLLVRQESGVVLIEPSLVPALATPVRGLARSLFSKDVGTVVVTHHHEDHLGGAGVHLHAGASVVTTPHAARGIRYTTPDAPVREVEAEYTIGQGPNRVVVFDVGATEHAERSTTPRSGRSASVTEHRRGARPARFPRPHTPHRAFP